MLKYDEQKIRNDNELMKIVNANNALDNAIYQQAAELNATYLAVSMNLKNYPKLTELDNELQTMIDNYIDANNVPIDEIEGVLHFMSDNN